MYSNRFVALQHIVKLYRILELKKIGFKLFLKRRNEKHFLCNQVDYTA